MSAPANPLATIARLHRVRRMGALGLGVIGVFDLVTSVLPPSRHHLTFLLSFAPLAVAQGAAVLLALCGLVLLALTRGLRRGQRQAWVLSCVVLVVAAVLHLARGVDGIQSGLSLILLAVLVVKRDAFVASTDRPARRSGALLVIGGLTATLLLSTASVEMFLAIDGDGRHLLPIHMAVLGVAERIVGVQTVMFPGRLNRFLAPTLLGVGLALAVFAVLGPSSTGAIGRATCRSSRPAASSIPTGAAPSTTSPSATTSSITSPARPSSPTPSTAGCASCPPTRSGRRASGPWRGPTSAGSPTRAAGSSVCWVRTGRGCRPTGPAACGRSTSATRRS